MVPIVNKINFLNTYINIIRCIISFIVVDAATCTCDILMFCNRFLSKKKKHLKQTLNNMQFLSERIKYDIGGQIDKRYDIQTDSQTDGH